MKRLILILIVVLILFGIMLACGLTMDHSGAKVSSEPSWMGLLEPLAKKSPITTNEILATACFVQGDLIARPNIPCAIHIRTIDESGVRVMKLNMISGHSSKIDLKTQGPTGMQIEIPLRSQAPKSPELQVPKEGAEVSIVCEEPGPDLVSGGMPGQIQLCRLRMSN
jgi:hypothetical protein